MIDWNKKRSGCNQESPADVSQDETDLKATADLIFFFCYIKTNISTSLTWKHSVFQWTRPSLRCWTWIGSFARESGVWTAPPAARRAQSATWRTGWSCCARTSPPRTPLTRAETPTATGRAPVVAPRARSRNRDQSLTSSTWAETDCPTDEPAMWRESRAGHTKNTTSRELCKCMNICLNECYEKAFLHVQN